MKEKREGKKGREKREERKNKGRQGMGKIYTEKIFMVNNYK